MNKVYFIIICILIALPVLIASVTIIYTCFKLGDMAGYIALGTCIVVISCAIFFVTKKIRELSE